MSILDNLTGLVAPHECLECHSGSKLLCDSCADNLAPSIKRCYRCHKISDEWRTCASCRRSSKLFAVIARTRYGGVADALVNRLKFENASAAARDIAKVLVPLLPSDRSLVVTYLPTASGRIRRRGYDQAKLIAKALSSTSNISFATLLVRTSQVRQVGSGRASRYEHASHMFRAVHSRQLAGKTIIVVDDVVTTGASLESAAAKLRAAGAKRIYGLTFCQA